MNIQNLENFKNLSNEGKRDVIQNLLVIENSQYNFPNLMTEYSEEIAINFSGEKKRVVNATPDKERLENEISIHDILFEYNPNNENNVKFRNIENQSSNETNKNRFNDDSSVFDLNIAFDDFIT